MKKLSKLKLSQSAEMMNEDEMRMIVGGYGSDICGYQQLFNCTVCYSPNYGNCVEAVICATSSEDARHRAADIAFGAGTGGSAATCR